MVSGSYYDPTIKIWNLSTGNLVRSITLTENYGVTLDKFAVLNNGYLVTAYFDFKIRIWDPDTGSLVQTLDNHLHNVNSLEVLDNGFLASASSDFTIKIWN